MRRYLRRVRSKIAVPTQTSVAPSSAANCEIFGHPIEAGQDPHGILFAGDRATRAIEQNISGTLRLSSASGGIVIRPKIDNRGSEEAIPFLRASFGRIRTCSPRLPH